MRSKRWGGFHSILCPVDFSEQSRLALRHAEAIANRGSATLTVTYANDPLLVAAAAAALHDRNVAKRSARELDAFVEATLARTAKKPLRVKWHVSVGSPAAEIIKTAARYRCDLIVMGTQGLTGADRAFLGSTTLSVLQRTVVPVLAVPRGATSTMEMRAAWPGERVLAAIELGPTTAGDVSNAAELARWFDASLLLVHVVGEITAPAWLKGDLSAHERIRVRQAERQIAELVAAAGPRAPTETLVLCGRPADEIAALAATERIDLVITALRDRRGWFGSRRGAVSYHVLSHAVTAVLAHPSEWRPR